MDDATILTAERMEQYRWVVPAKASQTLVVQFQSTDMGNFKENVVFEVKLSCMLVAMLQRHQSCDVSPTLDVEPCLTEECSAHFTAYAHPWRMGYYCH